jgi:hypothetical protein
MARRGMIMVKNQLHEGFVRVYDVADVAQSSLRIQTATTAAAFNLVAPGTGDTGIRVMTAAGVREIKSYLYAAYEDVSNRDNYPGYSFGGTERIYYGSGYWMDTNPNVMTTPRARTYSGRFVLNFAAGANGAVLNRTWYLWVDNGNGFYNTGLGTYVTTTSVDYAVETSFGEMTINRFLFAPVGSLGGASWSWNVFCQYWDYKINQWVVH